MIRVANLDGLLALADTQSAVLQVWEGIFKDWSTNRSITELSDAQRKFSAVYDLESEVNNGGFHQYFSNDASDESALCLVALAEMGATKAQALLTAALAIFPPNIKIEDRDARQEFLDEMDEEAFERLSPLDARWYTEIGDLSPMIMQFVRENREHF